MSLHKYLSPLLIGSAAVAMLSVSGPVLAQDGADNALEIEEIVVTARKRGESLQDVPATVVAFTEDIIDSIGVSSMRDYAKLVPNLFLIETQNASFTFVNIRGVTQMRNLDPSVAVVVDVVLSTSPISMSQELFDIEQIEVLKGPQGALYGRNAMAGAINITTKRPTNEFEGFARGGFGNGDSGKLQGSVSGPIAQDKLYGRAAFSYYNSDGFRENTALGRPGDPAENTSARLRLLGTPSDNFEWDLRFSVSDDNLSALGFIDISPLLHETAPGSGISLGQALGIFTCPGPACGFVSAGPVVGGNRKYFDNPFGQPAAFNVGNPNNTSVPLQNNLNGIDHRRLYNVSLKMDWNADWGTLTSITSWDKATDGAIGEQPPRTAVASQKNSQYRDTKAWSQEIRATSPDDQRLRWIAGGYIVFTKAFLSTTVQRDFGGVDSLVDFVKRDPTAIPSGLCTSNPLPPGSANDNQGNCVMSFDGDGSDNTAFALFTQFNYDVTDTLEASFSIRYDRDERDQIVLTPDAFLSKFPTPLKFGDTRSANFDSFQPKGTLRWTPQDNLTTYLTYSQGFRSGGFNRPGVENLANFLLGLPLPPAVKAQIPNGIFDIFPDETTKGFEGGFKYNTPGGRLVFNAAGFYTKATNYQTFTFSAPLNASQVIIPIDRIDLSGFEIDTTALLAEGLTLSVGFGYTDSEVKKDQFRGLKGNKAPQTPKTTLNIGLQYNRPVTIGTVEGGVFLRVDYQRIGKLFFMPENFIARNVLDLVNIRGGFEIGEGWQFAGWVKNAGNKNYFAEGFNPNGLFFPGKLRQWGGEITKRF